MENIESFKETSNHRYLISKDGQVWSTYSNKLLSCPPNKAGYRYWKSYHEDGRRTIQMVHKEVALAFIGPRPEGLIIRHKNGNSLDNNVSNIKYGTYKENSADSIMHGTSLRGQLSDLDVLDIRYKFSQGYVAQQLADEYNVSYQSILSYITGRTYGHLPGACPILDFDRQRVVDYVKSGYAMAEVSRVTGMSNAAISYLFRRSAGITIREFRKTNKVKFGVKIPSDSYVCKKMK